MASIIILTADEQAKFAAWLEQEADIDMRFASQMESAGMHPFLVRHRLNGADAKKFVAKLLRGADERA